jgi:hypothetical protein
VVFVFGSWFGGVRDPRVVLSIEALVLASLLLLAQQRPARVITGGAGASA